MNKIFSDSTDWENLLDFIADKDLVPVIGKEIYKFREKDKLIPIETYLSQEILKSYNVTGQPAGTLSDAINFLAKGKQAEAVEDIKKDVKRKLKKLVEEINFEFPLLDEFLDIEELNYFINTTVYSNLLETKLGEIRRQTVNSINFSLTKTFQDSSDLDRLKEPFVFNVFGSLLNTADPALSEDDMLEFTGNFKEKMENANNIIDALKNKNLLFLGCSFPDWMVRFVLRLLSNQPLTDWGKRRTIIVVNDASETRDAQFEFLGNYNVVTYEKNTDDFIHELAALQKARAPRRSKPKIVFLSYTIKDKEAVETLKQRIETIDNVTCWYDKHDIVAGDDFVMEIVKNIRSADLFIPLISTNSLLHKDGYIHEEWSQANTLNLCRQIEANTDKFFMPIVIDDTNPYDPNVPAYFSKLSIQPVPGGNPTDEFLMQIKKTLRLI